MRETHDIIVIGGGSAGCVLANRLSARPKRRVLLLEAGGSDRHPYSRIAAASPLALGRERFNWMYEVEADGSRRGIRETWPAGRCLGGGSAVNGMMFIRAHRWDFDYWQSLGNPGWAYEDVLPFYKRMEDNERGEDNYRGVHGPQAVSELRCPLAVTDAWLAAVEQAGTPRCADLNGRSAEGVDYCQLSQKRGLRHSSAQAYIWPELKKRRNLELRLGTRVQRILFEGKRACGVEFEYQGERKQVFSRQGIVLSAGAIASPMLLLHSGIGPAAQLRERGIESIGDLPGVGRNLQEHPALRLEIRIHGSTLGSDRGWFRNLVHGLDFIFRRRGPLTTSIGHAHAFVKTRPGLPAPNIQIILTPFAFENRDGRVEISAQRDMGFAVGLMRPRVRGEIQLRSADSSDKPLIRHELLGEPEDVAELLEGLQFARQVIRQPVFQPWLQEERLPGPAMTDVHDLDAYARDTAFPMYHPVGTCKMGSNSMAVVDHQLKLRGLDNLWVADASIMPTLPAGNTNATVIMIGEKASDMIESCLD